MSIKIDNLTKAFGGVIAVNDLSLSVPHGEMLVLLRPSGCGKTTTMRCIAGLERPESGAIAIAGRTVFEAGKLSVPINQRNVGMVFQSYAIWPHMSVYDNVAFPLRVKNLARAEIAARTNDMLAQVGLADLAARGASTLSGGQMQRVALARSLVMQPAALLFDEPLSNLDARLRDRLRIQLRELQTKFRITSVYVTHDQHEALALADRIAVMHRGALLQVGDPVSIYSQPASSTVADFIGYSNIFRVGACKPVDGEVEVAFDGSRTVLRASAPARAADELYACIRPEDIAIVLDADASGAVPKNSVLYAVIAVGLPLWALVQGSLRSNLFIPNAAAFFDVSAFSLQHVTEAATISAVRDGLVNSLIAALSTAVFGCVFFFVLAYVVNRSDLPGRHWLEYIAMVPLALPAIVLALGVLWTWLALPLPVYGTMAILVIAFLARFAPQGYRAIAASVIQIHDDLEHAALVAGASRWQTIKWVMLPLLRGGIAAAAFLLFVLSVREVAASLFLYTTRTRVLSIVLLESYDSGMWSNVASISLLYTLALIAITLAGQKWMRPSL